MAADPLWGTGVYWAEETRPGDRLFDPSDPADERAVVVEDWRDLVYEATGDVLRPLGRPDPIVVTDVRPYPSGTLDLVTLTAEDRDWLGRLLATGRIIGLRPHSPQYGLPIPAYLHVGRVTMARVVRRVTAPERRWRLDVQVVREPA